ncbi:hypothetical protein [Aquipuribacter sp. SD81]|uniref:hypothetical protein n=1 Tax=Aquipuribacter sp. SD81 TaxID=3127703 RepID=UPI003017EFF7
MTGRRVKDPHDVRAALVVSAVTVGVLLLVALVSSPTSLLLVRAEPAPPVAAPRAVVPSEAVDAAAGRPVPEPTEPEVRAPAPEVPSPVDSVEAALEAALDARDGAVARRTPGGWTAAGGSDADFRIVLSLPFTRFESEVVDDALEPVGDADPAAAGEWTARVRTTYSLDGTLAVQRQDTVTLRRGAEPADAEGALAGADRWRVVTWEPWPAEDALGTPAPWQLGPVAVARGERGLVLAWPEAPAGEAEVAAATTWAQELAGYVETGAVVVDSYLGTGWPRDSVLLAPATPEQFAALVPGERPDGDGVFAALTIDVTTVDGTGDVVVVNPGARAELTDDTWQVTLTHELVHVASGALYGDTQELWLAEGFADLVGWSTVVPGRVDRELVAARLLSRVRSGDAAATVLPPREAFSEGDADVVGDAYEGSWLAVLLLEDEIGTDALLDLYAQASDESVAETAEERTEAALLTATGQGREAFEQRWSAYVTALSADAR